MTTDFRALCAELTATLAERINDKGDAGSYYVHAAHLLIRARAALAKADEPAVPQGREPVAADLEKEFRYWWKETYGSPCFGTVPLVAVLLWTECVLARWGNPAPQPPADGEVAELVAEIRHFLAGYQQMRGLDPEHIYSIHRGDKMEAHITVSRLTRAAELLQRQALVPVSVSERLPGPEDCDAEGRCWWLHIGADGVGDWFQRAPYPSVTIYAFFRMTHWLPAHALPLPEVGE